MSREAKENSASDNVPVQILRQLGKFPAQFQSKVAVDRASRCWNWIGATHYPPNHPEYRYGIFSGMGAHQFSYEFSHGPLLGLRLDIDHRCKNKLCVNPRHLQAITHQDNCRLRKPRARVVGSVRWLREQNKESLI